jgi:hypothetical protein
MTAVQPPTREQIAEALWGSARQEGDDPAWTWQYLDERANRAEGDYAEIRAEYLSSADAVLALFPQPTPSSEALPAECGKVMPHNPHNWSTETTLVPWEPRICSGAGTEQGRRMREHALSEQMYQHMMENTHPAEPASIADMAPGTTGDPVLTEYQRICAEHRRYDGSAGDGFTSPHEWWVNCSCGVTIYTQMQGYPADSEDPLDSVEDQWALHVLSTIRNVTPPPATPEEGDRG